MHTIPRFDSTRTHIALDGHPVISAQGSMLGRASTAKAAQTLLNEPATLCRVNGATVFASSRCPNSANWSRTRW